MSSSWNSQGAIVMGSKSMWGKEGVRCKKTGRSRARNYEGL